MRRTLHLKKDTLTELTTGDLAAVQGGAAELSGPTFCGTSCHPVETVVATVRTLLYTYLCK